MRILAILGVFTVGAAMLTVAGVTNTRGYHVDDLGGSAAVIGLIALGVELYVIPLVKWKLGRN